MGWHCNDSQKPLLASKAHNETIFPIRKWPAAPTGFSLTARSIPSWTGTFYSFWKIHSSFLNSCTIKKDTCSGTKWPIANSGNIWEVCSEKEAVLNFTCRFGIVAENEEGRFTYISELKWNTEMLTIQTGSFNGNSMILNHKAGANVLR